MEVHQLVHGSKVQIIMISLHLHERMQNIHMWEGWQCGRIVTYLIEGHMLDFTLLQLHDTLNLSPSPAKSCLAEWEQWGKVADLSCCHCTFTRVSKETPYSTSSFSHNQPCDCITNFSLSFPKLQTYWEIPTVRNMVPLNFFPFQLQRGNIFSKLGYILGSIMPCRTQ